MYKDAVYNQYTLIYVCHQQTKNKQKIILKGLGKINGNGNPLWKDTSIFLLQIQG